MASLVEKINGAGVYISRGIHIIDNFLSTSRTSPASARTVKVLKDIIGDEAELPDPTKNVIENVGDMAKTFNKTVVPFENFNLFFSRAGKKVVLSIEVNLAKVVTQSQQWRQVAEIPEGYRPISRSYSTIYDPNGNNLWIISSNWVASANKFLIQAFGTNTTNVWAFGELTWLTSDPYPSEE